MAFHIGSPISKKRRNLLIRTYLPDWIITILLFGLFALLDRIQGYKREFDINDTSLMHTFAVHERVPPYALFMICALAPAVIILLVALFYARSFYDWNAGWLGLLLSIAVTATATNIIKICVGRPRPDLLDRCQPMNGAANAGGPSYGLTTYAVCTRTDLLNDGFRSFPSGHSSLSWAGLWFLTLYLAGKMKVYDTKGFSLKTWILLLPVMAAALVSVSRSMDYRHHATDIIAGSLLGLVISWYCYRQYFPDLSHPRCDKPFSPRVPRDADDVQDDDDEARTGGADSLERHSLAQAHQDRGVGIVNGKPLDGSA